MSPEIKIFVDQKEGITNKVIISPSNAENLGINDGEVVQVVNPDNNKTVNAHAEISEHVLDFAGKFSPDVIQSVEYSGVELIVRSISQIQPQSQQSQQSAPSQGQSAHIPTQAPSPPPAPSMTPKPTAPQPSQVPQPSQIPQPTSTPSQPSRPQPTPKPQYSPSNIPSSSQMPSGPQTPSNQNYRQAQSGYQEQMAGQPMQETPVDPYPNRIDVNVLREQRNGIILRPVVSSNIQGGRVKISPRNIQSLGLGQGMLIGWEDPLTRAEGSARIDQAQIGDDEIRISQDTKEDTNIEAEEVVVYSTEPPIKKAEDIMLEVDSRGDLSGYCLLSPRTQHTLSLQQNDVIAFEDELTGAMGAAKVDISEEIPDNVITIDSEILEASGIGSFEVKVSKNRRQIIPLQSVSLGITPITGENMWEIISTARQNITSLKQWLSNYIIFKGIKLRWKAVNIACSILKCVPDLTGDILAQITENTTLTLSPQGLIPFNAILILDISRSMMARDVLVTNIAPAIEGIKAAMESREIQEFLKKFKDGVNIPRRVSAAFAAVLFLSEKVGRGFGEKVSVIRFADEAQILPFGGSYYMDSASGKKGVLEESARMIVDRIGSAYGQATNMGDAMIKAKAVLDEFEKINPDQPTMIVLLTDGVPTDGDAFFNAIQKFAGNPNVVIYILGLGNPDDKLMKRAAQLCGGEYFKPEDAGELLVWYSKRARDLSIKLKAHKH
ncbi:MAG: VWA domain-containing protein [Candidatus Lokiarchaeota archaeon]|nr:VWA domain-containing protein [Candidatus Lokiarchaeota archaeon]MBD3199168.1 VWA domain-containing protein [Candidatus Lokiarchaeota archaeon]